MLSRPETERELSDLLRDADGPLDILGGGTRGLPGHGGRGIDMSAMTGVTLHDPGALTLVARAGTPIADLQALLAAHGQHLAFEPPDLRALLRRQGTSTLGGVIASNASGPRRVQAGAARDAVLGVRMVDGTGRVIANGGRVMKNVTGLDLARLMCGSHGTLGVLTEIALKVLPRPAMTRTLVLPDQGAQAAVDAMSRALGSPFEISGAAWLPGTGTLLRIEGFAPQVDHRLHQLQARLGGDVTEDDPWPAIRDVASLAALPGADLQGDVWRIHARPSAAPGLLARARADRVLLDWGGGLIWCLVPSGTDLRARLGAFQGHATLVRGQGQPVLHPEAPAIARITRGLRARFDPRAILNPALTGPSA